MKYSLRQQNWIIPLTLAALVALFGWWGNVRVRETLDAELRANLNATLDANVTALEIWTRNQIRMTTALAEEPAVRTLAIRILNEYPPSGGNARLAVASEEFGAYLRPRLNWLGYQVAQLVDTNFIVVAHSGRGRLGIGAPVSDEHTNKFAELFASGTPVVITPFRPEFAVERSSRRPGGRPGGGPFEDRFNGASNPGPWRARRGDFTLMQVAAPIRSDGIIRGALALIINPDKEFSRILSVARSGQSGETYAFDQTGLLISRSRFDDQLRVLGLLDPTNASSALNVRLHDPGGDLTRGYRSPTAESGNLPLIHMVAQAVAGRNGISVESTRDYRGVPVVGAWRWLPSLGFGVATQIDAAEAYHPLHVLRWLFVALFLMLLLCATGLFLFSYASLAWRRRLNEVEVKLRQLGQYTLEEKIGEGGMGVVYRARHALLRRETAVKLLLPGRADDATIERFQREVRLTCQLTHPNTIQVYDYGHTPEGIFYYAMEFLRGLNLHELVLRFGPQPEGRVVHLLVQICDSLAEAHALGLVHRDLKPANVFLCNRGGVPDCVKVLDFGLVQEWRRHTRATDGAQAERTVVGTPSFMAPETFGDATQGDPRSDIYSLGVLAYFLLTGRYLFEGNSPQEIYQAQTTAILTPPGRCTTNPISEPMESIVLSCLDIDPARRPQSVLDLRARLASSPGAASWTLESAAAWWARYDARSETAPPQAGAEASAAPNLEIDFASRVK
jgi:tRNA A-37 threonylcarbamoyl transferase component Bud32